jgi:hypothetical protein
MLSPDEGHRWRLDRGNGHSLTWNLQDVPYLSPIIEEIEAEKREREELDTMVAKRPAKA